MFFVKEGQTDVEEFQDQEFGNDPQISLNVVKNILNKLGLPLILDPLLFKDTLLRELLVVQTLN